MHLATHLIIYFLHFIALMSNPLLSKTINKSSLKDKTFVVKKA